MPNRKTGTGDNRLPLKIKTAAAVFLSVCLWAGPLWAEGTESAGRYFSHGLDAAPEKNVSSICDGECFKVSYEVAQAPRRAGPRRAATGAAKERPRLGLNKDYFWGILQDTGHILTSPLRWNGRDWFTAGAVLGLTGGFIALDNDIQEVIQDNRSGTTDDLAGVFEPFGNGLYTLPALAGMYLYGHFGKSEKAERVALLSLESFAITGLFTQGVKFLAGRPRPSSGKSSTAWEGPGFDGNVSFPSGHTSTAFAIATVFAEEYEETVWVPPLAYSLATLTALSRLNDDKHWASDVFLGGALGYFVSKTILKLHSDKRGTHYTIYPRLTSRETGLVLNYRF